VTAARLKPSRIALIGRSSSHFTRVARIFAAELGVDHDFEIVTDLLSVDAAAYGGNPALKLPSLRTPNGVWFGTLNVCRELARRARGAPRIVWPEALDRPFLANTQELVVEAMATDVALTMAKVAGEAPGPHAEKLRRRLEGTLAWLENNAPHAVAALPEDRELSYLEVTLFCMVTHLELRQVLPTAPYAALTALSADFGARASARATPYRFDR
jgi:glutathione S-transferase